MSEARLEGVVTAQRRLAAFANQLSGGPGGSRGTQTDAQKPDRAAVLLPG